MPLRSWCGATAGLLTIIAITYLAGCSQTSTEAKSPTPVPPVLEFVAQFGVRGGGPGQLSEPVSIATDPLGNVYIADAGSQFIHKFDWQGTPLLSFQEDALKHPQWIAVDSDGDIYVSDPVRGSVFVIYPGGERDIHRELRLRTRPGKEGFVSVAAGSDDSIYVLNSGSGKLDTYSPRFRLMQSWAPASGGTDSGSHSGPVVMGPDGNLYIFDEHGSRIMRFTDGGQLVSEIKLAAGGTGGRLSSQFAVSKTSIFAMDADGRVMHVWTIDGKPMFDQDLAPQLGQAFRPAPALAISARGELLVLDQPEARVLRYRTNF
ncbi:MAG: NHL repeat-containing protein [Candidatus Acidiferrales bacterium]